MPRGGARPNSGPKKGYKRTHTDALVRTAAAQGLMPLEYMLSVMRDEAEPKAVRMDAAKAAAPYVHARMVEHSGHMTTETYHIGAPMQADDPDEWQTEVTEH